MNNYIVHASDGSNKVVLLLFQRVNVLHANKGIFTQVDKGRDQCFAYYLTNWERNKILLWFAPGHQIRIDNVRDYHMRKWYGILQVFKRTVFSARPYFATRPPQWVVSTNNEKAFHFTLRSSMRVFQKAMWIHLCHGSTSRVIPKRNPKPFFSWPLITSLNTS